MKLLDIFCWENDLNYRFTLISHEHDYADSLPHYFGKALWEVKGNLTPTIYSWDIP